MSNVYHLRHWQESLCITLNIGHSCDFNRFLYLNCPTTIAIQTGKYKQNANRDGFIKQLKTCYDQKIAEGVSHSTLSTLFWIASKYLVWCDKQDHQAFTKHSVTNYFEHLLECVRLKKIKDTTYGVNRSNLLKVFGWLDLSTRWFEGVPLLSKNELQPYEAYSSSDLKQLLPLLRSLFKQTSTQFLAAPQKHLNSWKSIPTMTFHWQGKAYELCGAISKMMAAATYLLSYYTYANSSVLFKLTRPKQVSTTTEDIWYTMPAFKRRAFKIIHIEVGQHALNIPKYSMNFFDTLLAVSKLIDNSENALLLQTNICRKVNPICQRLLSDFNSCWLNKHFNLTDERGRELRPVISRFRETGSQLTSYHQGDIAQGIVLDNSPMVRRKHYSTGNRHENQNMTQETALIRQQQAISKSSAKQAQQTLNIDVLTIDESQKVNFPNISRTPNGGSCADPFGEKSAKFNRKSDQHNLNGGEKLACADLLKCFGCDAQVIVQSVSDIWCLLSFKQCIEESLYLHLDAQHYKNNFEKVINFIENQIIPKLNKRLFKQAETKLDEEGRHPLWQETTSVIALGKAGAPL